MGKVVSRVKGEARVSTPASKRAREKESESEREEEGVLERARWSRVKSINAPQTIVVKLYFWIEDTLVALVLIPGNVLALRG